MHQYSLEEVQHMEAELNKVKFCEAPIGGLCAQFIFSSIFSQPYHPSFRTYLTHVYFNFRELNKMTFAPALPQPVADKGRKSIVFNISANVQKNIAYFPALHRQFEKQYQCVIVSKEKIPFYLDSNDLYFSYRNLTAEQFRTWKSAYQQTAEPLADKMKQLAKQYGWSLSFIEQIKYNIKYQTKAIIYFRDLLPQLSSIGIICDHDRHGVNTALVEAGHMLNIPTYTLIHGSTFPPDYYYPLIADYMICWGREHQEQFRALGIDNERLLVCGYQKVSRDIPVSQEKLKLRFGYNPTDRVVTLGTNVIQMDQRMQYAKDFCKSLQGIPDLRGMIRIHPSEDIASYTEISTEYPGIKIVDNQILSFDESVGISDYIICHNSQFGMDALIKKKLVVIFAPDYITFPLGIGEKLHTEAGCPLVKTTEELASWFKSTQSKPVEPAEKAEQYVHSYIHAFGDDAARLIYENVTAIGAGKYN